MNLFSRIVLLLAVVAMVTGCGGEKSSVESITPSGQETAVWTPMPNDIVDVAQLPKQFQFTDEEIQRIRTSYRVQPDIQVDQSKSERIDCQNCAVIINGVILRPPFYLYKTTSEIYINGYRYIPSKVFPLVRHQRRSREELKKLLPDLPMFKCEKEDPLQSRCISIAAQALKETRDEKWIRREMKRAGLRTVRLIVKPGFVWIWHKLPCYGEMECTATGLPSTTEDISEPAKTPDEQAANNTRYSSLKTTLRGGSLAVLDRFYTRIGKLDLIFAIMASDADPRLKMYRLERIGVGYEMALAIFANNERH